MKVFLCILAVMTVASPSAAFFEKLINGLGSGGGSGSTGYGAYGSSYGSGYNAGSYGGYGDTIKVIKVIIPNGGGYSGYGSGYNGYRGSYTGGYYSGIAQQVVAPISYVQAPAPVTYAAAPAPAPAPISYVPAPAYAPIADAPAPAPAPISYAPTPTPAPVPISYAPAPAPAPVPISYDPQPAPAPISYAPAPITIQAQAQVPVVSRPVIAGSTGTAGSYNTGGGDIVKVVKVIIPKSYENSAGYSSGSGYSSAAYSNNQVATPSVTLLGPSLGGYPTGGSAVNQVSPPVFKVSIARVSTGYSGSGYNYGAGYNQDTGC